MLVQTADNVIATKKRIEYGVHQILAEVGELVKNQGTALNKTVNDRSVYHLFLRRLYGFFYDDDGFGLCPYGQIL